MLQPFHEAQHGLNTHEGRDLHAVMHLAIRDMVEHGTSTGLSCKYRRYQHALAPIITANAFGPLPDTRFGQRRRAVSESCHNERPVREALGAWQHDIEVERTLNRRHGLGFGRWGVGHDSGRTDGR